MALFNIRMSGRLIARCCKYKDACRVTRCCKHKMSGGGWHLLFFVAENNGFITKDWDKNWNDPMYITEETNNFDDSLFTGG